MASLADALSEEAVRDLREALTYEWSHLKPGRWPCRCFDKVRLEPPAVVGGGGSVTARSFSDILPSLEQAYAELPFPWRGRTKIRLLMLGHTEDQVFEMRHQMTGRQGRGPSQFEIQHQQRMRSELLAGWRPRPQDNDPEDESPFRRMASSLGWVARDVVVTPVEPAA